MKNIVICCDGTGNEISENISNVLKLYRTLRKMGKTEPHQVVFYDPGVGTLARPDPWTNLKQDAIAILGLTTGYGLDDNVLAAYEFLVNQYEAEPRFILSGAFVHQSVIDRMNAVPSYCPVNVPIRHEVVEMQKGPVR